MAATPVVAAQPTFVEIIEALRQNDVATLQAALSDQAMISELAAVDPESAVVLLLVFTAYLRPEVAMTLATQLWSCF